MERDVAHGGGEAHAATQVAGFGRLAALTVVAWLGSLAGAGLKG